MAGHVTQRRSPFALVTLCYERIDVKPRWAGWRPRRGAGSARSAATRSAATRRDRPWCPAWPGAPPTSAEFHIKPLALLADARLLADAAAEVVELRAVDVADLHHLELLDLRRVQRERPLDADAERLLSHGECLAQARALAVD